MIFNIVINQRASLTELDKVAPEAKKKKILKGKERVKITHEITKRQIFKG